MFEDNPVSKRLKQRVYPFSKKGIRIEYTPSNVQGYKKSVYPFPKKDIRIGAILK